MLYDHHRHTNPVRGDGDVAVLDPLRGHRGRPTICLRLGHHPLRPAAALRGSRPRGPARSRPLSLRQCVTGLDRRRCDGARHRLRLCRRRPHRVDDGQRGRPPSQVRSGAAARSPAPARAGGRMGAVRPDHRRPDRDAGTAARAAPALHPVAGAPRVDDALADTAHRRSGRTGAHRSQSLPPSLGVRRHAGPSRTSRA